MSSGAGGAWDCHAHVIGDPARFPLAPGRSYDPPPAPLEDYLALLDRRGIARGVLVQPSVYGFDNACMLDALDRAEGRLIGVGVPPPDASARDLESMHRRGVRGVRCNLLNPGGLDPEIVLGWRPVLHDLGWHVGLHIAADGMADLRVFLERFELPVVVDHMGRPDPGRPHVNRLIECVRDGVCFVKLSAPYRISADAPPWPDVTPIARALLSANARACVWASDWPHTQMAGGVGEDDLFTALEDWCPDQQARRILMEEAPRVLHGGPAR